MSSSWKLVSNRHKMLFEHIAMFSAIMLFLTVPYITSTPCFNCTKDVCYSVPLFNLKTNATCTAHISHGIRHVLIDDNIDYNKYVSSGVIMAQNRSMILFFDCSMATYSFYFVNDYSPVVSQQKINDFHFDEVAFYKFDKTFQKCLDGYCESISGNFSWRKHKFECANDHVKYLDFTFNRYVNHYCLQTMSSVSISSSNLTDINTSMFFNYAVHLIRIEIRTSTSLNTVKCNLCRYMSHLKLLHISYLNVSDCHCIFQYNRQLVRISNNSVRLWNLCNDNFELVKDVPFHHEFTTITTTTTTTTTTVQNNIATNVFYVSMMVVFALIGFMALKKQVRRRSDHARGSSRLYNSSSANTEFNVFYNS